MVLPNIYNYFIFTGAPLVFTVVYGVARGIDPAKRAE